MICINNEFNISHSSVVPHTLMGMILVNRYSLEMFKQVSKLCMLHAATLAI